MVGNVRMHGTNNGEVIDVFGDMRKEFAYFYPAFSILPEVEGGLKRGARAAFSGQVVHGQGLSVQSSQSGFGVKGVNVGWPAIGKNVDDAFCFGRKMWGLGSERGRFSR